MFTHNRDDHSKNFSYLLTEKNAYQLSPAYDLIFSSGPGEEHCATVANEGKNPGTAQLLLIAKIGGLAEKEALHIIHEVKTAAAKWRDFAKKAGVSSLSSKLIDKIIQKLIKQ